jgi:hypothetical protein
MPSHTELRRLVGESLSSLGPNLFVETLYIYQPRRASVPQGGAAGWSDDERTGLFNQMTAISTLAGIQYYSESRKTMRTFYEHSQVIDGPASKRPLPDPVFTVPPATLALHARQRDLTFGDNVYSYNYSVSADAIFLVQENETSMNAGIIPAIGRNRFRTVMAVIDAGDSILVYVAAMAKTVTLPGMGDRVGASFTNRVKAILAWFSGRADGIFR